MNVGVLRHRIFIFARTSGLKPHACRLFMLGSRWGIPTEPLQRIANSKQKTPLLHDARVGLPQRQLFLFAAHSVQAVSLKLALQPRHFRPPPPCQQQRRGTHISVTLKPHSANRNQVNSSHAPMLSTFACNSRRFSYPAKPHFPPQTPRNLTSNSALPAMLPAR